ncbi:hypothetical protein SAMN04488109_6194 [Chryseolinea serpens]|uniref:DKNYY family protein n=2 Tax=Chryseolinea serpens TaxID=947013 RepID=A0A1M5X0M2_9BACT|nr:hypothetical protein SAMN04488109_6194 [Chryseolinea serpens]
MVLFSIKSIFRNLLPTLYWKMTRLLCLAGFGLSLFCSIPCTAQPKADTAFVAKADLHAKHVYSHYIQGQARLFNGVEYTEYVSRNDEFPFYLSDDWIMGDVLYDGELYENVPLEYDIRVDQVVTEHLLNGAKIQLVTNKVDHFAISGHTFVLLYGTKTNGITTGFYDRLYDGATKVYVKREKNLQESIESQVIVARFEEKNHLYIVKDGVFYPVKKKGSVLDVLKDRKSDVKSFLNKSKIRFKKDREKAVVRAAEFYDAPKN